jgi:hypothetical protein
MFLLSCSNFFAYSADCHMVDPNHIQQCGNEAVRLTSIYRRKRLIKDQLNSAKFLNDVRKHNDALVLQHGNSRLCEFLDLSNEEWVWVFFFLLPLIPGESTYQWCSCRLAQRNPWQTREYRTLKPLTELVNSTFSQFSSRRLPTQPRITNHCRCLATKIRDKTCI